MKTTAIYIRVSTTEQLEFSPDAQKRALFEYAKHNNLLINEKYIFIDEGISGRKAEKRPQFMKMISTAKTKPKPFDTILVHKFDRFARNREDSVVYKSLLRKECDIQVISITEQLEDDKFSIILEAMLEAMAEYYSLNLSEEVKKGMTEKALKGEYQAKAPYGYQNLPNCPPQIIEEEANVVKFMFEKISNNQMSPFTLARYLNSTGVFTRNNNPWTTTTIKYILKNPFFTGNVVWNKYNRNAKEYRNQEEWISAKGEHIPIIDDETFEKVQKILSTNSKNDRSQPEIRHWLSGVIKCSNCGSTMSLQAHKSKYPFFQCHKYNKGACCKSHYITQKALEDIFLKALSEIKLERKIHLVKKETSLNKENDYKQLLKHAESKLSRSKSAYLAGIDNIVEYKSNKSQIEIEIENIKTELKKQKSENIIIEKNIYFLMEQLTNENLSIQEKNNLIKSAINKSIYNSKDKVLEVYFYID